MNELKAKPTRLRDTSLGDRHPAMLREVDRRAKSSKQSETATVRGQSYQKLCRDYCTQNGLRWGIDHPPSSAVAASPWFSALADAPSQILTILMKVHGEYCCVDTSQNVGAHEDAPSRLVFLAQFSRGEGPPAGGPAHVRARSSRPSVFSVGQVSEGGAGQAEGEFLR